EEGHCHLIRLYVATGQMDAARHQYDALERLLREELGMAPSPEAQALAVQLPAVQRTEPAPHSVVVCPRLDHQIPSPATPLSSPPPLLESPPPSPRLPLHLASFFGREAEIERLQALLGTRHEEEDMGNTSDPLLPDPSPLTPHASRLITLTGPGG